MNSELVERLRNPQWLEDGTFRVLRHQPATETMREAADRIEKLEAALPLLVASSSLRERADIASRALDGDFDGRD